MHSPRDAQQALRRIMERASTTCRFIFSTTNQSAIIPPIASRCLPLFFSPVDQDSMLSHLRMIRERENSCLHPCSDDDLELIAQVAQGDMRRAILLLQVALEAGRCRDLSSLARSETTNVAASALDALRKGDVRNAIRRLESLIIDYGLSGDEVFLEIRTIMQREYNHPCTRNCACRRRISSATRKQRIYPDRGICVRARRRSLGECHRAEKNPGALRHHC